MLLNLFIAAGLFYATLMVLLFVMQSRLVYYPEIGRDITEKKMITDSTRASMAKALDAFRHTWQA